MPDLQRALDGVKRRFIAAYRDGVPLPAIADTFNVSQGEIERLRKMFGLSKHRPPQTKVRLSPPPPDEAPLHLERRLPPPPPQRPGGKPIAKLTEDHVRRAHALYVEGYSTKKIATQLNVSPYALGMMRSGKNWSRLGLGPAYPPHHPRRAAWLRAQERRRATK